MILRVITFPTSVYSCSLQHWNTFQNKELTKLRNYISTYCFVFISKVIIMWIFIRLISLMCIIIFMVKHLQKCWIPWCTISQVKKKKDIFLVYGPLDQAVNLEGGLILLGNTFQSTQISAILWFTCSIPSSTLSFQQNDWTCLFWWFKESLNGRWVSSYAGHTWDCVHPDIRDTFPVGFMNSTVKYTFFTSCWLHDGAYVNMCILYIWSFFIKNLCCPGKELDD